MMNISQDLNKISFRKELIYLGLIIAWLGITALLMGFEEPGSSFSLNPLLQFKLIFVGIVYLGRELLFPIYRNRKILKGTFLVSFAVFACFQGNILTRPDWQYWLLRMGDGSCWSLFSALTLEPVLALAGFWLNMSKTSLYNYHRLWNRVGTELQALGFWLVFMEAALYFYLVRFYMLDTVFYSYLMVGLLWAAALGYYSIFASRTAQWVLHQITRIDQLLESYITIQPGHLPSAEGELSYLQWLMTVRHYIQGFKYPRIFIRNFLWYLIFSGFLLALPYLFGAIVEV